MMHVLDGTQQKKKIKTIYLVSQFIESKTIKDLDSKKMNQIFGANLKVELRYLVAMGLLQEDQSITTQLKRMINTLLYDVSFHSAYIKVTSKGRALVRGFEDKLETDRQRTHEELDSYLLQGDITNAIEILRTFYYGNTPITPSIWGDNTQPKTSTIQAALFIVEDKIDLDGFEELNNEELATIKLQAMELCLSDTLLIDRLPRLKKNLHRNGNSWLVNLLRNKAQQQALLSQSYHDNIVEEPVGQDSQLESISNQNAAYSSTVTDFDSRMLLPKVRTTLRFKITIPYIILATFISIIGAFILTQALLDSIEQRFFNQLIETGKLASDRMVIEENRLLETMRLIANTDGITQTIEDGQAEELRKLVLPLAVNSQQLAIEILDSNGISILSMRRDINDPIEVYEYSRGENSFSSWEIVKSVLARIIDDSERDKFAGFIRADWGDYFYTSGPIVDDGGKLVGVVLIGKPISTLVKGFRDDTLAHVTLYDMTGSFLSTSLLIDDVENYRISSQDVSDVIGTQDAQSLIRQIQVASIAYRELLGPWEARNGADLGIMGTALPESFLVNPSDNTRLQIFILLFLGLTIIISTGIYIARRITKPLMTVVNATQQVAQGNLNISIEPEGHDEVALLAHAFNHMVMGLQEVTERRFREIELVQQIEKERDLRELKSRFVSMVSHEFRTPLSTILSSAEYIRKYGHKVDSDKKIKHFDRIESSVKNMTELLEDVLLIGRTEAGRLEFKPELLEIVSFSQGIVDEMQANASLAHQIVFEPNVDMLKMAFDPRLMRLVLTNLLSNAIKYSPAGGEVTFRLSKQDKDLLFRVADTGIGISTKDQLRLFTPFTRAGNVGSIGGTGLGLYIVKMVVELHDGTVAIDSDLGQGTAFIITMPVKRG